MSKKLFFAIFLLSAFSVFAQIPQTSPQILPSPSPTPVSLETILTEAEKQTVKYKENFSNLLAEETKTFEDYDKNGEIKKTRRVESNFLVYQSVKNPERTVEYRNVTKVDGESVGNIEKRAEDFFNDVLKSDSAEKELEKIQKESSRYDKNLDIAGLTLNQAPILASHIRPYFDFSLGSDENYENRQVYVVNYQQNKPSPYVVYNDDEARPGKLFLSYFLDLPKSLKDSQPLLRGTLWIDKETFQVLRERRDVILPAQNQTKPIPVMAMTFDYQLSDLGVLTPKKITLTDNNVKVNKNDEYSVTADNKATFEYTKFTQSDVEVKSGEVNSTKIKPNQD